MKKCLFFLICAVWFAVFFPLCGDCAKLEKAEGCRVTDFLTAQPVAGVKVIATASSDLKSEQQYLRFETSTNKNGKYDIKGLAGKYYSINLIKDGYQLINTGISISTEGTTICRNETKLFPSLPDSDTEYNIYNPSTKKITKKIDHYLVEPGSDNRGFGDIHYFFPKDLVDKTEPTLNTGYLLTVLRGGGNPGWCRTDFVSRLTSLPNTYEIAKVSGNFVNFAKLNYLYSYEDRGLLKTLYIFPNLSPGYYHLGLSLDCGGDGMYIINIK